MTDIMMNAWGNFAREGQPGAVVGNPWPPFFAGAPHTMVLDGVASSQVVMESPSLGQLLREIEAPSSLDATERCLLMWEMVTNIGQPIYDEYARWNNGECGDFNVRDAKAAIKAALLEQYGSTSLP
jgi:para-nitrobenzyl esterase